MLRLLHLLASTLLVAHAAAQTCAPLSPLDLNGIVSNAIDPASLPAGETAESIVSTLRQITVYSGMANDLKVHADPPIPSLPPPTPHTQADTHLGRNDLLCVGSEPLPLSLPPCIIFIALWVLRVQVQVKEGDGWSVEYSDTISCMTPSLEADVFVDATNSLTLFITTTPGDELVA